MARTRARDVVDVAGWTIVRTEDRGTPWLVTHNATGYTLSLLWSRLRDAAEDVAKPRIWRDMWHDAHEVLTLPEHPTPAGIASPHDRARAALTWLYEHGHAPNTRTALTASE